MATRRSYTSTPFVQDDPYLRNVQQAIGHDDPVAFWDAYNLALEEYPKMGPEGLISKQYRLLNALTPLNNRIIMFWLTLYRCRKLDPDWRLIHKLVLWQDKDWLTIVTDLFATTPFMTSKSRTTTLDGLLEELVVSGDDELLQWYVDTYGRRYPYMVEYIHDTIQHHTTKEPTRKIARI